MAHRLLHQNRRKSLPAKDLHRHAAGPRLFIDMLCHKVYYPLIWGNTIRNMFMNQHNQFELEFVFCHLIIPNLREKRIALYFAYHAVRAGVLDRRRLLLPSTPVISTSDQFKGFYIDGLPKDPLFLANFVVCKDNSNFSGFRFDASGEADFVFAGESTNEIEGNVKAIHFVSLVLCCVCHASIIVI